MILDVQDLSFRYSKNAKPIFHNVNLQMEKGEILTILGANGAGKSTLFNAICGDFLTDAGSIELDGRDITFMPQHARAKEIGRLYQDPMRGTAPGMTIEENLALAAGILNRSAMVYTRRKIKEPSTIPTALTKIPPCPRRVPPISKDASAMVTIP